MANALTYQSEFTGPQMDERFAAVAQLQAALTEVETALSAKYVKPASGIPETDMDAAVQSALAKARSAVQDLSNYYTKTEIDALLSAVNSQEYVDVASLPTASASTLGKIYLVGPTNNQYDRYYTSYDGSDYSWVAAGSTEINLSNYATKAELNQLDQEVSDLDNVLDTAGTRDQVLATGATNNSYVNYQTGAVASSSANKSTDGIDVSEYHGRTIQYLQNVYTGASGTVGMAFYDSNNTFVSGVPCHFGGSAEGVEETTTIVPNNATYAKFTILKDYADSFYVKALGDYHSVRLDDLESASQGLNFENTMLKGHLDISLPTSSTYQPVYYLKKGRSYSLTTTSNTNVTISIWPQDKSASIQQFSAIAGATVKFTPSADAYWIKSGVGGYTGTLQETLSVNNLDGRINTIQANTNDSIMETLMRSSGVVIDLPTSSTYQHIPFKKGMRYCIVTTSPSMATLTIWPQDKSAELKRFTPSFSTKDNPYIFTVDSDGYWIKAGAAYSGILYYYPQVEELMQARLNNALYQFGVGIDCKYETPLCPAYTMPEVGQRCSYFYGLYDALLANYPNYITKVDCDSECVADGIVRPDYMNDYPIYMYKFIPAYTPSTESFDADNTQKSRLKVFIVTGTHPEYMAIYDLYLTMKAICENWATNDNIDALRWDAEYYIMPCSGPWGVDNSSRINYNGVDLNRNAPASNWQLTAVGESYSGPEPASEYETKVLVHYMEEIKPQVFIDHHNFSDLNKNLIYITCRQKSGIDLGASHISDMTRRWKIRFDTIFPSDDVIYGFSQRTLEPGTRGWYGSDKGALGFTYESCQDYKYTNGEYDYSNWHSYDVNAVTMATDGFLNFLLRVLKTYSEIH